MTDQSTTTVLPPGDPSVKTPTNRRDLRRSQRKLARLPPLLGVAATVLMALRLLAPVAVGMADNGDGSRLLCHLGVRPGVDGSGAWTYFQFAELQFGIPTTAHHEPCTAYPSSTQLLMRLAMGMGSVLHLPAALDLRMLMVLYAVVAGVCVAWTVSLIGRTWRQQLAVAVVLFVVVGDGAFADFSGSPFTETGSLFGLLVMAPAAIAMTRRDRSWPIRFLALVLFAASSAMAVSSKVSAATILVAVAPFLLWVGYCAFREPTTSGRRAASPAARLVFGALAVVSLVGIVIPAVITYRDNPKEFEVINTTQSLFVGILPHSDDPAATLEELGIAPELARYSGVTWWAPHPPQNDPAFAAAESKISYGSIAGLLARHPGLAIKEIDDGAQDYLRARSGYLGTYQKGDGEPRAHECRLCVVSSIMENNSGMGLLLWGPVTVLCLVLPIWVIRRTRSGPAASTAMAGLLLSVISPVQFATARFGDGTEFTKHMATGIMAGVLGFVLLVLAIVQSFRELGPRPWHQRRH